MKQSIINRTISLTALVALIAVVPGCSPGVDGDYTGAGGMMTVELHGGKATVKMQGESKDGDYKVDGDTVTITPKGASPLTLTRASDGSLKSDMITLTRK